MLIQKGPKAASSSGAAPQAASERKPTAGASEGASDLGQFAREILDRMSEEKIPPLPSYYELYFETMLQDKPFEFRKEINEQLSSQNTNDEQKAHVETKLKEGFSAVKDILQNVSSLYKQLLITIETTKKRATEAKGINNPAAVQNFATTLSSDAEQLANHISKQANVFKDLYAKSAAIVKEVETESIFDAVYGIYNRRYLLKQIDHEAKMIGKFNHSSTLLLAALKPSVTDNIASDKGVQLVNKTMAKLFLKTSRRSDIVAYFGQGIFGMLLKHTDVKNAVRTSERLSDMMRSTNFFLGDKDIELKISISVTPLLQDKNSDSLSEIALTTLRKCDEDEDASYLVSEIE